MKNVTSENVKISRDNVEICHESNPLINLKKIGFDFLVISQNNQNICIYRSQINDFITAILEIDEMFEKELSISNINIQKSISEPNRLDLLVAGKLEEYDSNRNLEFEPKTLMAEDIVYSDTDEIITITEVGTRTPIEDKIETIIVSDIVEKKNTLSKKSKKPKINKQ